ncbi:MAG TPA: DUF2892 domain-containing protein [Dermatophilaceae bacterium]|nr:DUF2892 domain-containing protein [Dermatophilaceae bacterium]
MRSPFTSSPGTVGREDRLVRGGIALSLLLLAGFAVTMSGSAGPISIVFGILGVYFSVTAALGRDPLYAYSGIDTRTDSEVARATATSEVRAEEPDRVLDLRDRQHLDERRDSSLLGN